MTEYEQERCKDNVEVLEDSLIGMREMQRKLAGEIEVCTERLAQLKSLLFCDPMISRKNSKVT